jgi:hypothetical protein
LKGSDKKVAFSMRKPLKQVTLARFFQPKTPTNNQESLAVSPVQVKPIARPMDPDSDDDDIPLVSYYF